MRAATVTEASLAIGLSAKGRVIKNETFAISTARDNSAAKLAVREK